MYQKQKLHAGLQLECKVCTPDQKPKRRKYNDKPKVTRGATTLEGVLRRQLAEEIGEAELTKDGLFATVQKFGLAAPRIDRKVTKPSWKQEKVWRTELNEWFKSTKGLVEQVKTFQPRNPQNSTRRTSAQTATATRPQVSRNLNPSQSRSNPRGLRTPRPLRSNSPSPSSKSSGVSTSPSATSL